jgi:hypothetical protein
MFSNLTIDFSVNIPIILSVLVLIVRVGFFGGKISEKLTSLEKIHEKIETLETGLHEVKKAIGL